jgi:hypothetical protein
LCSPISKYHDYCIPPLMKICDNVSTPKAAALPAYAEIESGHLGSL